MRTCSRDAALPCRRATTDAMHLAADQRDQQQHEAGIDGDQRQRRRVVRGDRRRADQNRERDGRGDQRADDRHNAGQREQAAPVGRSPVCGNSGPAAVGRLNCHSPLRASRLCRMYATHCGDYATSVGMTERSERPNRHTNRRIDASLNSATRSAAERQRLRSTAR